MSTRHESGPIAWMTRHGVAPNILMLVLVVGGLLMTTQIRQEVFPDFSDDAVTVTVPLPGASPEEVEESVILAIEEELRSVEGVEEIRSTARESVGQVVVDILAGADRNRVFQDVQQAVSRVTTFPDDAEAAIVALNSRKRPVLDVLLYGDMDEWGLRQAAEELRDALLLDPNITEVELRGAREMEIHVEIPEARLREHGLTIGQVATVLRQSALDRGGGGVKTSAGEILLRVQERREAAFEFAGIPIITGRDGAVVRLADIATISEGFEDSNTAATFNGKRAIALDVFRVGEQTPISVSDAFHARAPAAMAALPPGLELAVQEDRSLIYKQRLNLLLKNGAIGLALVLLILALFLEFKLAMWVATGIATAFAGTLLLLPATGTTINMVSMFAFILALGIVVDDAIVTGENIYEYRQRGMGYVEAAARGARDIAVPVSFSILTNIVAFWPLMTIPGGFGKIWAVIPVVVVLAFVISWVEALFILPSHLAHVKDSHGRLHRMQQGFSAGFNRFVRGVYGPFLRAAIRWRYLTIACMIAILAAVVSLPASGRMGFILMPQVESEFSQATATLPVGAPMAAAEAVRDRLVTAAERVVAETGGDALARGV
ncbi:MAG: AcrB/AcrD/AcrF family protein, partial [Alphaproteobacteria bacterium HGW-Alphaproteobacteria-2]